MSIRVELENGQLIEGQDKKEVVEVMAKMAGDPDVEKYMVGVKFRCFIWNKAQIEYTTVEEFFDALVDEGVIVRWWKDAKREPFLRLL